MTLLKRFIQKLKAQPTAPAAASQKPVRPRPEPEVIEPLKRLQERRQLLRVHTNPNEAGNPEASYQSMLLALDLERGLIWLDHLFPRVSHLKPGETLTLSHSEGWHITQFTSRLISWRYSAGTRSLRNWRCRVCRCSVGRLWTYRPKGCA